MMVKKKGTQNKISDKPNKMVENKEGGKKKVYTKTQSKPSPSTICHDFTTFLEGTPVEVSCNDKPFSHARWYTANIENIIRAKHPTEEKVTCYIIKYKNVYSDPKKQNLLIKGVDPRFVRPLPPSNDDGKEFEVKDVVDVYHCFGWRVGTVENIVVDNNTKKYGVKFMNSDKVFEFEKYPMRVHADKVFEFEKYSMRVHADWVDSCWKFAPKKLRKENDDELEDKSSTHTTNVPHSAESNFEESNYEISSNAVFNTPSKRPLNETCELGDSNNQHDGKMYKRRKCVSKGSMENKEKETSRPMVINQDAPPTRDEETTTETCVSELPQSQSEGCMENKEKETSRPMAINQDTPPTRDQETRETFESELQCHGQSQSEGSMENKEKETSRSMAINQDTPPTRDQETTTETCASELPQSQSQGSMENKEKETSRPMAINQDTPPTRDQETTPVSNFFSLMTKEGTAGSSMENKEKETRRPMAINQDTPPTRDQETTTETCESESELQCHGQSQLEGNKKKMKETESKSDKAGDETKTKELQKKAKTKFAKESPQRKLSKTSTSEKQEDNKRKRKSNEEETDSDFQEGAFDKYRQVKTKKRKKRSEDDDDAANKQTLPVESEQNKKKTNITRTINLTMSPRNIKHVVENLTKYQKDRLNQMGFADYTERFDFYSIPGVLGMWVFENFNPKTCSIEMQDGRMIKITRELIHDVLGIPMGDVPVQSLKEKNLLHPVSVEWRRMMQKIVTRDNKINISALQVFLSNKSEADWIFDVGFLSLFFSIFGQGNKDGTINERLIPFLEDTSKIHEMDWCSYALDSLLKECNGTSDKFAGPLLLLALVYVHSTVSKEVNVETTVPVIKAWNSNLLRKRQKEEIKLKGFGLLPIKPGLELTEKKKIYKQKKIKTVREDEERQIDVFQNVQQIEDIKSKSVEEMKDNLKDNLMKGKKIMEDTDNKLDIAIEVYPDDEELKSIIQERNKLYHVVYSDVKDEVRQNGDENDDENTDGEDEEDEEGDEDDDENEND